MVDIWPLCGYIVCYGSASQANSAFHPSRAGNWAVIHAVACILRGWRPGLHVAVWLRGPKSRVHGLSLQPIGCKPALSVTQSATASAVYSLWCYVSDGPIIFAYSVWIQLQEMFLLCFKDPKHNISTLSIYAPLFYVPSCIFNIIWCMKNVVICRRCCWQCWWNASATSELFCSDFCLRCYSCSW